ncbi:N/A [soil metagenome]
MKMFNPPHPGAVLHDAIEYMGMSIEEFADLIGVEPATLVRIADEQESITPEMSAKFGAAFGQPDDIWFKVQRSHDQWRPDRTQQ